MSDPAPHPARPHAFDALPIHLTESPCPAPDPCEPPTEPEFRRDPTSGRWVVVAPERASRPLGLAGAKPRQRADGERHPCPFCPGQEVYTPHELLAVREPGTPTDGPGWSLRVVPNKYPAVKPFAGEDFLSRGGLFESFPGVGRHEVVVDCPDHVSNPAALPAAQLAAVLLAYRDRLVAHAADPHLAYSTVFKNVGAEAGASLAHSHSQIVATPIVPDVVRQELTAGNDYYARHRRCVFCDVVRAELADGCRLVARTDHFVAVAPYASRFAYELCVLPAAHGSRYEPITGPLARELAGLLKRVLTALDAVIDEAAYNWFLHTAPLRSDELPYFHWHLEVMPRTSRPAGFEWGAGCYINAVPPETAAARLRAALPG